MEWNRLWVEKEVETSEVDRITVNFDFNFNSHPLTSHGQSTLAWLKTYLQVTKKPAMDFIGELNLKLPKPLVPILSKSRGEC